MFFNKIPQMSSPWKFRLQFMGLYFENISLCHFWGGNMKVKRVNGKKCERKRKKEKIKREREKKMGSKRVNSMKIG